MEAVTRRRSRALVLALAAASAVVPRAARAADPPAPAASSPADAEAQARARASYARGLQLYNDGAFGAALVELQRAYQLSPTYRLLYNTALVQMRLDDFVGATKSFRAYLDGGGGEIPAARRAEVERYLADLAPRIGHLDVTTSVPGAEVSIDDVPQGGAPLASLALNPGRHRVVATKDGYRDATKWIDLAGSDRASVALDLEPNAPAPVAVAPPPAPVPVAALAPPPPPSPPPPPPESKPPLWIGWTATGVFAAGAIVTGVAALSQSSKLGDEVSHQATDAATIHSTHDATQRLAIASDVLSGLTLVAAGTTLYFTFATKRREAADAPRAELRIGPGSLGVRGAF